MNSSTKVIISLRINITFKTMINFEKTNVKIESGGKKN